MITRVLISGAFDDLRYPDIRFLDEAAQHGDVNVLLWSDPLVRRLRGQPPKFPAAERVYFLRSLRPVSQVEVVDSLASMDALPERLDSSPSTWVVREAEHNQAKEIFCRNRGLGYRVLTPRDLKGFPASPQPNADTGMPGGKKVIVTGCYDWLHSGHIRFFEEVRTHGELYVVLGHDANIRLLKGEGHPLFPQEQRRYVVGAVRFVTEALIATGHGWLDAEPEIERLKPDIYAVNEDGDKGGKREFCAKHGIQYLVLKRTPAPGLPPRSSTDLRGF